MVSSATSDGAQHSKPPQTKHAEELTFRNYTSTQATFYATNRPQQNPKLTSYVLDHHFASGGQADCVIDLGTGHGNVIRSFAPSFERAFGLDPSAGMLGVARQLSADVRTKSGTDIEFTEGAAERIHESPGVQEGGVDLIVAGTAAHWFNLPPFYASAARALKAKGTIAFWVLTNVSCHPTQRHAKEIQGLLDVFDQETLDQWMLPGNRAVRDGYKTLALPWEVDEGTEAFPESGYHRRDWNERGECGVDEEFFAGSRMVTAEQLGKTFETASPVTRWREDEGNKAKIEKGELRDCVEELVDGMKGYIGEEGMHVGLWTALVMLKRA